jgi:hypothetical protein
MFGHTFRCSQCEHTFHAGITGMLKTDALPDATFYQAGDSKGMWVTKDKSDYCGPCSDKVFPQITEEGVEFKKKGVICF